MRNLGEIGIKWLIIITIKFSTWKTQSKWTTTFGFPARQYSEPHYGQVIIILLFKALKTMLI